MLLNILRKWRKWHRAGQQMYNDPYLIKARKAHDEAVLLGEGRTDVINYILRKAGLNSYLEIGVRNPDDNFNLIRCENKISVDPGVEFGPNPVRYKMTSDDFFTKLRSGLLDIDKGTRFDLIFIDGLHLSYQADRDIANAIEYISDKGFIVVHDCNPPTEFHAREEFGFKNSPASHFWNGTTWKAFYKHRFNENTTSVCIDMDWGLGVITKMDLFNRLTQNENPFFEFHIFDRYRIRHLNLLTYDAFKVLLDGHYNL